MGFCIHLNFYYFISLSAPSSVTRVPSPEFRLGRTVPFSLTSFAQEGWTIARKAVF